MAECRGQRTEDRGQRTEQFDFLSSVLCPLCQQPRLQFFTNLNARSRFVLTGPHVILTLKIAVIAVTVIFAASLVCLLLGRYRWHGRLNIVFFTLTLTAVLGLEMIIRFIDPTIFDYFSEEEHRLMAVPLRFSIPAAVLLPIM